MARGPSSVRWRCAARQECGVPRGWIGALEPVAGALKLAQAVPAHPAAAVPPESFAPAMVYAGVAVAEAHAGQRLVAQPQANAVGGRPEVVLGAALPPACERPRAGAESAATRRRQ